jgi:hypothetical protein
MNATSHFWRFTSGSVDSLKSPFAVTKQEPTVSYGGGRGSQHLSQPAFHHLLMRVLAAAVEPGLELPILMVCSVWRHKCERRFLFRCSSLNLLEAD